MKLYQNFQIVLPSYYLLSFQISQLSLLCSAHKSVTGISKLALLFEASAMVTEFEWFYCTKVAWHFATIY